MHQKKGLARAVAAVASTSLIGASLVATGGAAQAAVSPTAPVIINEVYGGGGNTGATYTHDYIELLNVSAAPVDLSTWTLKYSSQAGTSWSGSIALAGSIAPGEHYLVQAASATNPAGVPLPVTPRVVNTGVNLAGANGNVALVSSSTLTCQATACATDPAVVDLVGFGTGAAFAGTGGAPAPSNSTAAARKLVEGVAVNTGDNAADFVTSTTLTPGAANVSAPVEPPADPVDKTIAEIQGTGSASPLVGTVVRTRGVVTAAYPTGGFNGFVIQTPGPDTTPGASDGVFVYVGSGNAPTVTIGQHVTVEGTVAEFNGLTQITTTNAGVTLDEDATGVAVPATGTWPTTEAEREALEGMLFAPTGDFTVSNTYSTNQYGEVGLASGTKPLIQWTDVAVPGSPEAAAVIADNAARGIVLDDGATTNFLSSANQNQTPPYLSTSNPVRVGAAVTFTEPVIVDYRNSAWKLNPVRQAVPGTEPATFENTRTAAPDAARLGSGDVTLASFNVLNYFTTLGVDLAGCTSYKDRAGNGVTVNSCPGNGPRGAWDADALERQQDKIVAAINALDADVIGLLEIENSAVLGEAADEATATLVDALNDADPSKSWEYVTSSTDLPAVSQQDVISNAIIYQSDAVAPLGRSRALGSKSASGQPFANAREPLAQAFEPVGGGEPFLLVVNHFKSKGSAGPLPGDADAGDGQGSSNASRIAQATALRDWVPTVLQDLAFLGETVDDVALVGDFNSYSQEDPLQVLYAAGYTNADKEFNGDELFSYSYSGLSGSLDHVLLNDSFLDRSTGADVWNINSGEALALEYSRYNYHGTTFYEADPYRSSDHDPVIVAFDAGTKAATTPINLLNINDFHGRIDADTPKFAGTIEQLRAELGEDSTLFLSNGDNIGASLFASSSALDQPTIDVLNALDLKASGVGNHEFDQGITDLTGRVSDEADFPYLAANVYAKGTENPVLDEYTILDVDGIKVGVVGAVTEETPTLVTPGGIASLDFGDPVEAVNRVAAQLTDGDLSNGEADVIVAQYHEGAGAGTPDGATLEQEIAAGGAFAEIVTETSAAVDVIFTGHTHKEYVWEAPVPGGSGATRPVVQTGSYGANIGQVVLSVDPTTKQVVSSSARNVKRVTTANATLAAAYPRVAEVVSIVDAAIAEANIKGAVPVGSVTADITSALAGGSYVDGTYVSSVPGTTTGRDDRASESALGNLVAEALRESLAATQAGADFGVVNPGGLRAELLYAKTGAESVDGVITYAEANAVLPFLNNLWSTTLTGAQVKTMLEQQWQTNPDGSIPSRPFLKLGLSDNVSYTFDESRPAGDRVTSIRINGTLVTPDAEFRVGTFSFLAQGGDNFRVFKDGTGTVDSGLIDRDAWIAYLETHPNLTPSFARHAVAVSGAPSEVTVGDSLAIDVSKLNLTSLGAPENTSLAASFSGGTLTAPVALDATTVTAGAASVTATVPAGAAGATTLTLTASPSGTTVVLPITVKAAAPTPTTQPTTPPTTQPTTPPTTEPTTPAAKSAVTVTARLAKGSTAYGTAAKVTVTVKGSTAAPSGKVRILEGSKVVATGTLKVSGKTGTVTVTLPKTLKVGKHTLKATYAGSSATKSGTSKSVKLTVVKAKAKATVTVSGKGRTVVVKVSATGTTPSGKVTLRVDGRKGTTLTLKKGKATFRVSALSKGKHTYKVSYAGSKTVNKASVTKTSTVR